MRELELIEIPEGTIHLKDTNVGTQDSYWGFRKHDYQISFHNSAGDQFDFDLYDAGTHLQYLRIKYVENKTGIDAQFTDYYHPGGAIRDLQSKGYTVRLYHYIEKKSIIVAPLNLDNENGIYAHSLNHEHVVTSRPNDYGPVKVLICETYNGANKYVFGSSTEPIKDSDPRYDSQAAAIKAAQESNCTVRVFEYI